MGGAVATRKTYYVVTRPNGRLAIRENRATSVVIDTFEMGNGALFDRVVADAFLNDTVAHLFELARARAAPEILRLQAAEHFPPQLRPVCEMVILPLAVSK